MKSSGHKRSNKPEAFKSRVRAMSGNGTSIRKIAKQTGVSAHSIISILNEPEAKQAVEQAKYAFMRMTGAAVKTYLKKIENGDIKLATRVLINEGILDSRSLIEDVPPQNNPFAQTPSIGVNVNQNNLHQSSTPRSQSEVLFEQLVRQMAQQGHDHKIPVNGNNGHKEIEMTNYELDELKAGK